jgi:magnesium-transporting ATPase (P-type)
MTPDCHAAEIDECLEALATTAGGLASSEASQRLEKHGPNRLPQPPRRNAVLRFLAHFHNILIYVLIGSAAITAAMQHFADMAVILAVVIANAVIGFIQEGRAEEAMESIRGMLAPRAAVLRDGERRGIPSEELVPGDIVLLEAGDKVPADLRLIRSSGLRIQEAILTGESVPAEKATAPVAPDAALGDRSSMAYSGTMVTAGQGRGLVAATGAATEIGRISGLLAGVEVLTTPLVRQMNVFAKWLTVLILLIAAALLAFGYFVAHYEFTAMFMAVVGLSVAAIPEGLPAVLTITLAVGVQAMARRHAIVRRLPAIETLGSVSVICTDKTGTLTRNEMMVASAAVAGHLFAFEGNGYEPDGAVWLADNRVNGLDHLLLAELASAALPATTRRCTAARDSGWSRATRWKARFWRSPARSASMSARNCRRAPAPTKFPSIPATSSWRPFTTTIPVTPTSSSRARPNRSSPCAPNSAAFPARTSPSRKPTGPRARKKWPPVASVSWPSPRARWKTDSAPSISSMSRAALSWSGWSA